MYTIQLHIGRSKKQFFTLYNRISMNKLSELTPDYIPISEAAKILKIKESTVREYIARGRLISYKWYHVTVLRREDIIAYRDS